MQLNCKLIKKWRPPNFYIIPPLFQGYCPFLAKFLLGPMSGRSNPNPIYKRGGGDKNDFINDYKIWYLMDRECISQRIDYCRWSYGSHWNCINSFQKGIVNDQKHSSQEGTNKINMNPHSGSCCFFPWMYWYFSWHWLVYLGRFARFHSHFNFIVYIWSPHIRASKSFDSNNTWVVFMMNQSHVFWW